MHGFQRIHLNFWNFSSKINGNATKIVQNLTIFNTKFKRFHNPMKIKNSENLMNFENVLWEVKISVFCFRNVKILHSKNGFQMLRTKKIPSWRPQKEIFLVSNWCVWGSDLDWWSDWMSVQVVGCQFTYPIN